MADNITITEGTAKAIAADDVSSVWYQRIKLDKGVDGSTDAFTGTIDAVSVLADGTVGKVGTVTGVGVLADGTVAVGSFDADLPGGTVDIVASGTIKSIQGGTVGKVDALGTIEGTVESVGTVQKVGTVDRITRGTLDSVGTIPGIGVIADGTVVVGTVPGIGVLADGTLGEVGTIPGVGVLALGTVKVTEGSAVVKSGTITTILAGTQELLGTVAKVGTVDHITGGTVGEIGTVTGIGVVAAGSTVVKAGTVTTILAGTQELLGTTNKVGTVDHITDGTIAEIGTVTGVGVLAGGTVQINPKSPTSVITYGTQITGAAQTWATLSAASGEGTYHYVQGCSIVVKSGTVDCFIGFGSALSGTNVIAKGNFSEGGGGIARSFTPSPLAGSGTNTELICEIGGAGTVDFTVDFWRGT